MRRSILLIIGLSFNTLFAFAQAPIVTSADMYSVNEAEIEYRADSTGIVPGAAGANVTWDFSGLKSYATKDSIAQKYLSPSSTPYGNNFPTADIAVHDLVNKGYYYYTFNHDTFSAIGLQNGVLKQVLDKPEINMVYPFTYNSSITSDFHETYNNNGATGGTQKIVGDGYGTIKIKNKTYDNVLRVHVTTVQSDSISGHINGTPYGFEQWIYLKPGKKDAILIITTFTQKGITPKDVYYNINDKTLGIIDPLASIAELNIFPNPAQKISNLSFNAEFESKGAVSIINELGQQVNLQTIQIIHGMNNIPLNISSLSKGVYFVNINSVSEIASGKLVVE